MAKGNLILGMGRGSIGDVTMYRANGEQISRARNRHPNNPKTFPQLVQRSVMASVLRTYSLGKVIFDHSFQGVAPGKMNQRKFISVNAKKLRAAINADLKAGTSTALVGAPGIMACVPNEYIVAQGSYDQNFFQYADGSTPGTKGWKAPAVDGEETIGEYAAKNGLIDGDIYTILGVFTSQDTFDYEGSTEQASVRHSVFGYVQVKVKDGVQASTDAISASTKIEDIFDEYNSSSSASIAGTTLGSVIYPVDIAGFDANGAWGVIRSRENEDLRSNCTLVFVGDKSGVTAQYIEEVWGTQASQYDSDLILEGSNFSQAGGSATPTLPTVSGFYAALGELTGDDIISVTNPVVFFDTTSNSVKIAFNGTADAVAGESAVIVLEDGEVTESTDAIALTTSELNAYCVAIASKLSEKYGVAVAAGVIANGDNESTDQVIGNI